MIGLYLTSTVVLRAHTIFFIVVVRPKLSIQKENG